MPAPLLVAALAATCWMPPVDAPVTDPFRAPACTWCPGNRGIEYGPEPGRSVTAVAGGVVSFAGTVVATRYVVVLHDDGLRATYGRLAAVAVRAGDQVHPGTRLGTTSTELYFGLRRGDEAVDPTPFLGTLRRRPRLVPVDGTPRRPGPPPRLVCGNEAERR